MRPTDLYDPAAHPPAEPWQLARVAEIKRPETPRVLPVVDFDQNVIGRVVSCTQDLADDRTLIETFVRWRNQNLAGWLDQRPVTQEGTERWFRKALADPSRLNILFYAGDKLIGRGGMIELSRDSYMSDGIVRGERGGGINFMHFSNFACMSWDFANLGISTIYSKVLATNEMALSATKLLGYEILGSVPLYVKNTPSGTLITEEAEEGLVVHPARLWYLSAPQAAFEEARERAWTTRSFHSP